MGEFADVDESAFYADENALNKYLDDFPMENVKTPGTARKRRPKPKATKPKKEKVVKEKKVKKYTNPILPDGSVKKGRPRKEVKKRKREEDGDVAGETESPPSKKKRGRPRKYPLPEVGVTPSGAGETPIGMESTPGSASTSTGRKRGRPRKVRPQLQGEPPATPTPAPKKRGRPRKSQPEEEGEAEQDQLAEDDELQAGPSAIHDGIDTNGWDYSHTPCMINLAE